MGHSLALVFAQAGYEVDLVDMKAEALEKACGLIRSNLETLKTTKMIPSGSVPKILKRIQFFESPPHPSLPLAAKILRLDGPPPGLGGFH